MDQTYDENIKRIAEAAISWNDAEVVVISSIAKAINKKD